MHGQNLRPGVVSLSHAYTWWKIAVPVASKLRTVLPGASRPPVAARARVIRRSHAAIRQATCSVALEPLQDGVELKETAAAAEAPSKPVLPGGVAIASRTRTQPSAIELLAYQLPGRNTHTDRIRWGVDTRLRNKVQLSTYPDCIGGDLPGLTKFAEKCAPPTLCTLCAPCTPALLICCARAAGPPSNSPGQAGGWWCGVGGTRSARG